MNQDDPMGPPLVHRSADVARSSHLGSGTHVWQHAQVREGAWIGSGCILGRNVYIDADVVIGSNCKIQNGVSVFGPARLEDGVFLGPGAILTNDRRPRAINPDGTLKGLADWRRQGVIVRYGAAVGAGSVLVAGVAVGRWALVGAGTVVRSDVADHALVLGNPAVVVGYVCACGARLGPAGLCPACGRDRPRAVPEP